MAGVPVVTGSMIQIYEPGWKKGLYSTNWNDVAVLNGKDGKQVTLKGLNIEGSVVVSHLGDEVTVRYQLTWKGPAPVHTEISFGHLWAPAFETGTLAGVPSINRKLGPRATMAERQLRSPTDRFDFKTPFGGVTAVIDRPATLFDARGYSVEITPKNDVFWLGVSDQELRPGVPTDFVVTWKFSPTLKVALVPTEVKPQLKALPKAFEPTVIPKQRLLGGFQARGSGVAWALGTPKVWPKGSESTLALLGRVLKSRFSGLPATPMPVEGRIRPLGLAPGGFEVRTQGPVLVLTGQDAEGLRNAAMFAVDASEARSGKWQYVGGVVRQSPEIAWRGVHLFVGPESESFQKKLIDQYFAPMRINRVVLQCERVAWDAAPGTSTSQTMSKASLKRLVKAYRDAGIEPIPLIQSWGHMEWLFANGQNLNLAANRAVPYGINPENPASRTMLAKIWREAFQIFDSNVMHVGLDEVDMRGWEREDPEELTRQWKLHVGWLGEFAKSNGKTLMLWGDHLLAPGQAPDAMNGNTVADAKARRDALPRGSMIADWHYINNANPDIYTSLALFKREGLHPIASPWHRPENIRGFTAAANMANVGVLQTTWAGYTSTLANMVRNPDQFTQYLQMAHYAWTGEGSSPFSTVSASTDLARLLVQQPRVARPRPGTAIGPGVQTSIGPINFLAWSSPEEFFSRLDSRALPSKRVYKLNKAHFGEVAFAMSVKVDRPYMAVARVTFKSGSRVVGQQEVFSVLDLRRDDSPLGRYSRNGVCAVELNQKVPFDRLEVESLDLLSGLRIHGITVY